MNEHKNPYFRFVAAIVGTVVALHIAWELIRPVLPAIGLVIAGFAVWRVVCWHRDRW